MRVFPVLPLKRMKKLARLILFFSISFVVIFAAAILLRLLSSWIDYIRVIPLGSRPGEDAAEAAWKVLPIAVYSSILLALSYSSRRNISIPVTIICILVLGGGFSIGASLGISRVGALNPALKPVPAMQGKAGLVLSQSDNIMVLLKESSDIRGPRVVSIPGRPLIYQEVPLGPNNTILNLPDLPFGDDTPWFVRSLNIDFSLSSGELKSRLGEGFYYFAAYIISLILLLGSLRFIMELSKWHLANLFLGALVFRLILLLETFLNTREINSLIASLMKIQIPSLYITPMVFCALSILILFYTLLTSIARRSRDE